MAVPALAAATALFAHSTPRQAFRRGWLIGFATHCIGFYWLPEVLVRFAGHPALLAWTLCLVFHALGALRFALVGYGVARCRRTSPVIALPVLWTAMEFLWPAMFPWRVGHLLLHVPALAQVAEFTGAYGPSFLVAWAGSILYAILGNLGNRAVPGLPMARSFPPWRRQFAAFCAAMILTAAFGAWRIRDMESRLSASPELRVALVQPGTMDRARTAACMALSRSLNEKVDLFVWPESAIGPFSDDFNDFADPEQLRENGRTFNPLNGLDAHVLAGGDCHQRNPVAYFNSAMLADPAHRIVGRYDKRVLIPFGEYIPGEQWFPALHRFSPWEISFSAGASAEPLVMENGTKLGICICYEDVLDILNRRTVAAGAEVLVNLTNDAWFGRTLALEQHRILATYRAIENRRFLLRCTTTGTTCVIDPMGRVIASLPPEAPRALTAVIQPLDIATFYTRFGNVFGWLCVAAAIVFFYSSNRRRTGSAPD